MEKEKCPACGKKTLLLVSDAEEHHWECSDFESPIDLRPIIAEVAQKTYERIYQNTKSKKVALQRTVIEIQFETRKKMILSYLKQS